MSKFLITISIFTLASAAAQAQQVCTGSPAGPEGTTTLGCASIVETVEVIGLWPGDSATQPVSVTRLSAEDLAVRGAPNAADQLRAVPGVAVSRSGGPGALTQVRMRGAEANHTLVLLNGIDVSDPVNGETDFGLLTLLPTARIDVLRGQASAIHGSDAIGGVVLLDPRGETGWQGQAEGGSFSTGLGQLSGRTAHLGAAFSTFSTDGVDTSGLGGETDGSRVTSGVVDASAEIYGWTIEALALARRATAQSDSDADFDGRLENSDVETDAVQTLAGFRLSGKSGIVDHRLRASWNQVKRENWADDQLTDDSTGKRLKASWNPSAELDQFNGRLTGLIEAQRETYERTDTQFAGFTNADEQFDSVGLAAEYTVEIGRTHLVAGVRQDFNDNQFGDAATWRLGAALQFPSVSGRFRLGAGSGFKKPTFTELYGFFPGSFIGNPDLKPESSLGAEIGWDQYFNGTNFFVSLTGFSANLDDEIYTAFSPDFTATALNRDGSSKRFGTELATRYRVSEALTLQGQVSLVQSENDSGETEIRVPELTASLSASWQASDTGPRFSAALDHIGAQDDFDFGAFPAERVELDAYTLLTASLDYPISRRVALTLRGENLFDQEARDVFGFNTPGAGVFVGVKLRQAP
jgi:vitamin B12 transporter